MSILSSTYLEDLPDRDRWGNITNDDTIAVHVAVSGYDIIHLMLEEGQGRNSIEVNMSIDDALELHAQMAKAIGQAMRRRRT